jgi:hypothetical protein
MNGQEEKPMNEQNEPLQFPLVAPAHTPAVRVVLRCVIFGLAQYVSFLPASKEKELCFEALDRVVMRFQGSGFDEKYLFQEDELGELLEACGGFLLTLYNTYPEKEQIQKHITSWCGRLSMQVTAPQ